MRKLFLMIKEFGLPHHWKHWQALTVTRMYLPLVPSWNRSLQDRYLTCKLM